MGLLAWAPEAPSARAVFPLASSKACRQSTMGWKTGPRGKALVLHLSGFRCSAAGLRVEPRHTASPTDNDNLHGSFRRQSSISF